jgi:hypothetical protein
MDVDDHWRGGRAASPEGGLHYFSDQRDGYVGQESIPDERGPNDTAPIRRLRSIVVTHFTHKLPAAGHGG